MHVDFTCEEKKKTIRFLTFFCPLFFSFFFFTWKCEVRWVGCRFFFVPISCVDLLSCNNILFSKQKVNIEISYVEFQTRTWSYPSVEAEIGVSVVRLWKPFFFALAATDAFTFVFSVLAELLALKHTCRKEEEKTKRRAHHEFFGDFFLRLWTFLGSCSTAHSFAFLFPFLIHGRFKNAAGKLQGLSQV